MSGRLSFQVVQDRPLIEVFAGIIGMDIIKQAVFILDGPSGSCSLIW
jgi:hypothetical protein